MSRIQRADQRPDRRPGRTAPGIPLRILAPALLVAAVALFAGGAGAAETEAGSATLLTLKSHQDAVEIQGQTQPARDQTVEIWIGDGAILRDDGQSRVLLTEDTLYLINEEEGYYNALDRPVELASLLPEEMRSQLEQMREQGTIRAQVVPGDETRQVGDWTARRYDVSLSNEMGLEVDQVLWASEEVQVDPAPYFALTRELAAIQPGGAEWTGELEIVKGFPVYRETVFQVGPDAEVRTTEELVSVEEKTAPEGIFAPPADFEEREFDPVPRGR